MAHFKRGNLQLKTNQQIQLGDSQESLILYDGTQLSLSHGAVELALDATGVTVIGGAINITQTTAPPVTTDKLYNVAGTLTWEGKDLTLTGAFTEDADENIIGGTGAGASLTSGEGTGNFFAGVGAGASVTTGDDNIAIGTGALPVNLVSSRNIAIGEEALLKTTSTFNIAIGVDAGRAVTSGGFNIAIGGGGTLGADNALFTGGSNIVIGVTAMGGTELTSAGSNIVIGNNSFGDVTTSSGNALIGEGVGQRITTGIQNSVLGYFAGESMTTGGRNVAIGSQSLGESSATLTGDNNIAIGRQAIYSSALSTATENIGIGTNTLNSLSSGVQNVAIGQDALDAITTGSENVAIGDQAGRRTAGDTTRSVYIGKYAGGRNLGEKGSYTTAVGAYSMGAADNGTALENTALGYFTMYHLKDGTGNVAIGTKAGQDLTDADHGVYIGYEAGQAITTGNYNIAMGYRALGTVAASVTGADNIAIGRNTMAFSTGAIQNNVAIGATALINLTTGISNVAVGQGAQSQIKTGDRNTSIGHQSGTWLGDDSDGNVTIGYFAGPAAETEVDDQLYINNSESNTPLIGGDFSTGIVRFNGALRLTERADHIGTPAATFGELWIRDDTPNTLMFTDDDATDIELSSTNIVEDTSPQLGGDLDVNDFSIVGKPAATVTSIGGDVTITAADGGATSGLGGDITISSGEAATPSQKGTVYLIGREIIQTPHIGDGTARSIISSGQAQVVLQNPGASVGSKNYALTATVSSLIIGTWNDDFSSSASSMVFARSGSNISYIQMYDDFRMRNGASSAPSYGFSNNTQAGMYYDTTTDLEGPAFGMGGSSRLVATTSGLRIRETAAPTIDAAAYGFLYIDSADNLLRYRDESGNVVDLTSELYYDGDKKLEATADGITVTGTASADVPTSPSHLVNLDYMVRLGTDTQRLFWNVDQTGHLDIHVEHIRDLQSADFDSTIDPPDWLEGRVFWDKENHTFGVYNDVPEVTLQVGQESHLRVRNISGATIPDGSPVYISGADQGLPTIELAKADDINTLNAVSIATHDIDDTSNGYTTVTGAVNDVDTSGFGPGDSLYVSDSTAGVITNVRPKSPNIAHRVGVATDIGVNGRLVSDSHPASDQMQVLTYTLPLTGVVDNEVPLTGTFREIDSGETTDVVTPFATANQHLYIYVNSLTGSGNVAVSGAQLSEDSSIQDSTGVESITIDQAGVYYQTSFKWWEILSIELPPGISAINFDYGVVGYPDMGNRNFSIIGYRCDAYADKADADFSIIINKVQDDGAKKMSIVQLEDMGVDDGGAGIVDNLRTGALDRSYLPTVANFWEVNTILTLKQLDFNTYFTSDENDIRSGEGDEGFFIRIEGEGGGISNVDYITLYLYYELLP